MSSYKLNSSPVFCSVVDKSIVEEFLDRGAFGAKSQVGVLISSLF